MLLERAFSKSWGNSPFSSLEGTESLEQLRWLEAGYRIRVMDTERSTIGIDTPEDLERAEAFLKQRIQV